MENLFAPSLLIVTLFMLQFIYGDSLDLPLVYEDKVGHYLVYGGRMDIQLHMRTFFVYGDMLVIQLAYGFSQTLQTRL